MSEQKAREHEERAEVYERVIRDKESREEGHHSRSTEIYRELAREEREAARQEREK